MSVLYLAGQRPGSGATAIAAGLAVAWRRTGRRVALADGAASSGPEEAARQALDLASDNDVVIVEGPPLTDGSGGTEASSELARRLGATVVGVLPYARGLDAQAALPWQRAFGEALGGLFLNRRIRYAGHDVKSRLAPELAAAGAPALAALPEDRLLLAPTVRQVLEMTNATLFTGEEEQDELLIEHFLIGGLILEWGGQYFGRFPNQAVIARGGRLDLGLAALEFPLNLLLLTGVDEPPQYVYERAYGMDVPLAVTNADTHATAQALERVHEVVTAGHPQKTDRMADLLAEHADWPALNAVAGLA